MTGAILGVRPARSRFVGCTAKVLGQLIRPKFIRKALLLHEHAKHGKFKSILATTGKQQSLSYARRLSPQFPPQCPRKIVPSGNNVCKRRTGLKRNGKNY
jgi:hypothetical protein